MAGEEPSQQERESTAAAETAEPVSPASVSAVLSYGNAAFELSEGDGGNEKEMLKDVLVVMSLEVRRMNVWIVHLFPPLGGNVLVHCSFLLF